MKREQKTQQVYRKKVFDKTKRNVYCIFKTKKSFYRFQSQLQSRNIRTQNSNIFNQQISIINSKNDGISKTEQTINGQSYKIGIFSRQFNCIKCQRRQTVLQSKNNICSQCQYLDKIIQKGNFQKFVNFLFDFKTKKPQKKQINKLKIQRIQSIESCQSLILNKGEDNATKPKITLNQTRKLNSNNRIKQSNKSIHSSDIDRHYQNVNDLISSLGSNKLGYFCNQCQAVPIVGRRFHCQTCQDFDLCQKCYFYIGHKHNVKTFDDSKITNAKKIQLQVLKRSQKLKNTLNFLSSSIQNFQAKKKLYHTSTLRQINKDK